MNPLIDNGFMYTTDGWGTVYKIDARDPNHGQFVWICRSRRESTRATRRARAASRCGKTWSSPTFPTAASSRSSATTAKSCGTRRSPATNEFGSQEKFFTAPLVAEGKVLIANGAGDAGTRGWVAALDVKTGKELWRWYVMPEARRSGQRDLEGQEQRLENRRRRHLADRLLRSGDASSPSGAPAIPVPQYDPQSRPGDNLYTDSVVALNIDTGKLAWYFQYTPNDSWDYDEIGVHMLYDTIINGQTRKVVGHFGAQRLLLLARPHQRQVHQGRPVRQRPELDQGHRSEDRQAGRIRSEARRADLQSGGAGAARRPAEADLPDLARRRRPPAHRVQSRQAHRLRRRHRRLLLAERRRSARSCRRTAASTARTARSAPTTATSTTARSRPSTRSTTRCIAKAVTDIEIRSGATDTAGGVVFTALQDGWVVAYNDETLEELWRFNVGHPAEGRAGDYAIGPKQYLAVQASGRHLHPVKYDNLAGLQLSVRVRAELSTTIGRDCGRVRNLSACGLFREFACKRRVFGAPDIRRIWRGPSGPCPMTLANQKVGNQLSISRGRSVAGGSGMRMPARFRGRPASCRSSGRRCRQTCRRPASRSSRAART